MENSFLPPEQPPGFRFYFLISLHFHTDNHLAGTMKKPRFIPSVILVLLLVTGNNRELNAWRIQYAEQFYKLYHQHLYRYPQESAENIWYLSMALRSPFANPLNALAKIENEKEWEKYRLLFYMHVYLKIINEYLSLGSKYDKSKAYFYNYPWKYVNLESLKIAEDYYILALEYWKNARNYAAQARDDRFRWMHLEEIPYWEDEASRIENGELDYQDIIESRLERLESVRADFKAMNYDTY